MCVNYMAQCLKSRQSWYLVAISLYSSPLTTLTHANIRKTHFTDEKTASQRGRLLIQPVGGSREWWEVIWSKWFFRKILLAAMGQMRRKIERVQVRRLQSRGLKTGPGHARVMRQGHTGLTHYCGQISFNVCWMNVWLTGVWEGPYEYKLGRPRVRRSQWWLWGFQIGLPWGEGGVGRNT